MLQAVISVLELDDNRDIAGEEVMAVSVLHPEETVYFKALLPMDNLRSGNRRRCIETRAVSIRK